MNSPTTTTVTPTTTIVNAPPALSALQIAAYDHPARFHAARARKEGDALDRKTFAFHAERIADALTEQLLTPLEAFARQVSIYKDATLAEIETGYPLGASSNVLDLLTDEFMFSGDTGSLNGSPLAKPNGALTFARRLFPGVLPDGRDEDDGGSDAEDAFRIARIALVVSTARHTGTNPHATGAIHLLQCAAVIAERFLADGEEIAAQVAQSKAVETAHAE